jgi:regulator of replication initiation timing
VTSVEKKDIFTQIDEIEQQMGSVYADLTAFKKKIIVLLEENKRLSIENQQLRKLLKREPLPSQEKGPKEPPAQTTGEGYDNLARLYYEGFHICNVYYGHLRTEGDCLFCLSFFNK